MTKIGLAIAAVGLFLVLSQCNNPAQSGIDSPATSSSVTTLSDAAKANSNRSLEHAITVDDAQQMMDDFQANNPFKTYGWYLSREAFEYILANPEAAGIRIYGGRKLDGSFSPVLIGIDSTGIKLIESPDLNKSIEADSLDNGIRERAQDCPPFC